MIRTAFLGSPASAIPTLAVLLELASVDFVVTQPDRPQGRGRSVDISPVKRAASEWGLPVYQPRRDDELLSLFSGAELDVAVVVAYGRLLRPEVLATTDVGFVNVHFSLLPRWRGAAPVERAILAGDDYTGVSLMVLDEGLDTGPVFAVEETPINEYESAGEVKGRLAWIGADVLRGHLEDYVNGRLSPARQMRTGSTTAPRVTTAEARLDPTGSRTQFSRVVRAFNPKPGAWFVVEGARIKVFEVGPATPNVDIGRIEIINGRPILGLDGGSLELVEVQPAGKAPQSGRAWANGRRGKGAEIDREP
jgi:methionyl-tRNA formyltransferase